MSLVGYPNYRSFSIPSLNTLVHSCFSYAADKQTEKQTDSKIVGVGNSIVRYNESAEPNKRLTAAAISYIVAIGHNRLL